MNITSYCYRVLLILLFLSAPLAAKALEKPTCDNTCSPEIALEVQCKSMDVCISHCGILPQTYQSCVEKKWVDQKFYDTAMAAKPGDDWLCAPCQSAPSACLKLEECEANCLVSESTKKTCQETTPVDSEKNKMY